MVRPCGMPVLEGTSKAPRSPTNSTAASMCSPAAAEYFSPLPFPSPWRPESSSRIRTSSFLAPGFPCPTDRLYSEPRRRPRHGCKRRQPERKKQLTYRPSGSLLAFRHQLLGRVFGHLPCELDLVARNLAGVFDANIVPLKIEGFNESDDVARDLPVLYFRFAVLRDGLARELVAHQFELVSVLLLADHGVERSAPFAGWVRGERRKDQGRSENQHENCTIRHPYSSSAIMHRISGKSPLTKTSGGKASFSNPAVAQPQ